MDMPLPRGVAPLLHHLLDVTKVVTLGGGDPLAGRAVRTRLAPFTQGELAGQPSNTVERWWTNAPEMGVYPELELSDLFDRLTIGGLPAIALQPSASMGGTASHSDAQRLFTYLDTCDANFLLESAPAHRPTQHQTVTAHPRVFASDVGLAAWAAQTSPERLLRDPKLTDALLENLVAAELGAQAGWANSPARLLHWRDTRAKKEVDLKLSCRQGLGYCRQSC